MMANVIDSELLMFEVKLAFFLKFFLILLRIWKHCGLILNHAQSIIQAELN